MDRVGALVKVRKVWCLSPILGRVIGDDPEELPETRAQLRLKNVDFTDELGDPAVSGLHGESPSEAHLAEWLMDLQVRKCCLQA